jgi:hypothetical protein
MWYRSCFLKLLEHFANKIPLFSAFCFRAPPIPNTFLSNLVPKSAKPTAMAVAPDAPLNHYLLAAMEARQANLGQRRSTLMGPT